MKKLLTVILLTMMIIPIALSAYDNRTYGGQDIIEMFFDTGMDTLGMWGIIGAGFCFLLFGMWLWHRVENKATGKH